MLLHGWPYDIHTYGDVAPLLASKGYRVIVPHLRGYGTTRFLSTETVRNGQPSALVNYEDTASVLSASSIRPPTNSYFGEYLTELLKSGFRRSGEQFSDDFCFARLI
ncbi:MAG TPA: alpha/beta fold hydrolase [Pyrinomonadaceae bacterium]|jgi:pimeloyl-ACP methyl ester carboxylesterase